MDKSSVKEIYEIAKEGLRTGDCYDALNEILEIISEYYEDKMWDQVK